MHRRNYQLIFERYPIGDLFALEVGAWDNPWLMGTNIVYMDRERCPAQKIQVIHDLEDIPYPFENKQFDVIALREVLEHVCPKNQVNVMNELYRIMKPQGLLLLTVPYYKWHGAHSTPDHCKYFTEHTFDKFTYESYRGSQLWRLETMQKIREKDRLRYMPIRDAGQRIKSPLLRKLVYRLLSVMPWKYYTRNLFVTLKKVPI